MRKLASIQIISDLQPIENADRILLATVMGWNVIVKKGEFEIGSKCVFFEIDSVLPDGAPWAEFMRSRKFRVKTCKLRGALSQGLALPMSILGGDPNPNRRFWDWVMRRDGWRVGDDATEVLRVKKHDPHKKGGKYGFKSGQKAGDFPSFISKTNEKRIQSSLSLLNKIVDRHIYIATKCDGTSSTFYNLNDEFVACSRNRKVKDGDNVYWDVVRKYELDKVIPDSIAIQGEIVGPNIQNNHMRLKEVDLFVFNLFDIKKGKYLEYSKLKEFCEKKKLKMVPVESEMLCTKKVELSEFLEKASGKYEGTDVNKEGIVVRTFDRSVSFKVLNNDFLLKEEK